MTQHDPWVRVRHMLEHSEEAVAMADGRRRSDLDTDRQFSLAMTRLLEIVGEAFARIPSDFRGQYPHVPWRDIADLRNRLIHGYDQVDHRVLWDIVELDLPPLVRQLQAMLNQDTDG